jgi:hypothetical protein
VGTPQVSLPPTGLPCEWPWWTISPLCTSSVLNLNPVQGSFRTPVSLCVSPPALFYPMWQSVLLSSSLNPALWLVPTGWQQPGSGPSPLQHGGGLELVRSPKRPLFPGWLAFLAVPQGRPTGVWKQRESHDFSPCLCLGAESWMLRAGKGGGTASKGSLPPGCTRSCKLGRDNLFYIGSGRATGTVGRTWLSWG